MDRSDLLVVLDVPLQHLKDTRIQRCDKLVQHSHNYLGADLSLVLGGTYNCVVRSGQESLLLVLSAWHVWFEEVSGRSSAIV